MGNKTQQLHGPVACAYVPSGKASTLALMALLATCFSGLSTARAQGGGEMEDDHHYFHFEVPLGDADPDTEGLQFEEPTMEYEPGETTVYEDSPALTIDDDVATFDIYGFVWFNYHANTWGKTPGQKFGNFQFNQFRLGVSASWRNIKVLYEMRFWTFMIAIRQAWIQYSWDENAIQLGLIQRPWAREPWSSSSWWFSLAWYVGLADDYDLGLKYIRETDRYRFDLFYGVTDVGGFQGTANTWATDVTPTGEQQNRQFSTGAARFVLKLPHGENARTDLAAFGSIGLLENQATGGTGNRWYAGAMYTADYNGWRPLIQITRQEFNADNPDALDGVPVDSRLIRMSQFGEFRDMAAKAWLVNFALAKTFALNDKWVDALVPYVEYSWFIKDEDEFEDSQLLTPGMQVHMGPVWLWLDILIGRNATFLNDSAANPGIGAGAIRPQQFEVRPNLQIQYYF